MPTRASLERQLKRAIVAVQTGRPAEARRTLAAIVRQDPQNAAAWLWLGKAMDDPRKRAECFTRVLRLDPGNDEARTALVGLRSGSQVEVPPEVDRPEHISAHIAGCPQCGSHLRYDISDAALRCEHCGERQPIPQDEDAPVWLHLPPQMTAETQLEPISEETLRCHACGSTSALSAHTASLSCPFCGSPQVVRGRHGVPLIAPRGIMPFQLDREGARQALQECFRQGWWRPLDLARRAVVDEIHGVYLPFWVFDGSADVIYHCVEGAGGRVQVAGVNMGGVLIPASFSIDEDTLRQIEPFDLEQVIPYRPEYLAGWPAEIYQVALADASIQVRERAAEMATEAAHEHAMSMGGEVEQILRSQVVVASFLHVLLPVWVGSYRYRDRLLSFAINGQTGRVGGEIPRSKGLIALVAGLGLAALVILLLVFNRLLPEQESTRWFIALLIVLIVGAAQFGMWVWGSKKKREAVKAISDKQ